jgi:hypothetical protein
LTEREASRKGQEVAEEARAESKEQLAIGLRVNMPARYAKLVGDVEGHEFDEEDTIERAAYVNLICCT